MALTGSGHETWPERKVATHRRSVPPFTQPDGTGPTHDYCEQIKPKFDSQKSLELYFLFV
jgi:hypothetical protein